MNLHDTATTVLTYALQSGLLLIVGLAVPRLLRLRHPQTLLAYWRVLLLAVILLPLVGMYWQPTAVAPVLRLDAVQVDQVVASALPSQFPGISRTALFVAAAAISFFALVRLAAGFVFLQRCRRRARPLDPLPQQVSTLQDRLQLEVPILVSERLNVPLTFGWLRPAVIVPKTFRELSADEQEGVACHELLHVRRRDWPTAVVEEIVRALLWFHPAVWILLPKIVLAREQVVDAGTVRMTGKRRQYLDGMWRIVQGRLQPVGALALPLLGRSHLFERVELLKEELTMSKGRTVFIIVVLAFAIGAAGVIGASVFPAGTPGLMAFAPDAGDEGTKKEKPKSDSKLKVYGEAEECEHMVHPQVIEKVNPVYPESARKEKVQGIVTVETVLNEEGVLEDVTVIRSDDERFSQASIDAVKQWKFEPALCDGKPVGVYYNLTLKFSLQ